MITVDVLFMIVLALAARFLTPKMMYAESAAVKFGLGVGLFALYTAGCLSMFHYLCTVNGTAMANLSGVEVWNRVICAFLLMNLCVLIAGTLFYFTREKRTLTQKEKMKLKDL